MAMRTIETDTMELRRDRQAAQDRLTSIQAALKQVYAEVAELDAMWDGTANMVFNKQFASDKETFEDVCKEVQALINNMTFAQEEYDRCENQVHSTVSAIKI